MLRQITDDDFISLFRSLGAQELANRLNIKSVRWVYAKRRKLEAQYGIEIAPPNAEGGLKEKVAQYQAAEYNPRKSVEIKNGYIVIGSDFHIWPGAPSTALRAFKKVIDDVRPAAVILNGDVMDFPQISRHPPIGWERSPDLVDELEAAQDHLHDIVVASKKARKIWTLGNHDARFESRLAAGAPQFKGIRGIHLGDHFPLWEKAWSVCLNPSVDGGQAMVKHRIGGNPKARVQKAGMSVVTGHLHCQNVTAVTTYKGTNFSVDTGCVADIGHAAFDYTEDGPLDWRSGFGVFRMIDGYLMPPELVTVLEPGKYYFRGEVAKA